MNNPKRGFVVYFDNYPMLLAMPPEQRGLLFTALMQYADGRWRGEVTDPEEVLVRWPDMGAQAQMGFRFTASALDRATSAVRPESAAASRPGRGSGALRPPAVPRPVPGRSRLTPGTARIWSRPAAWWSASAAGAHKPHAAMRKGPV